MKSRSFLLFCLISIVSLASGCLSTCLPDNMVPIPDSCDPYKCTGYVVLGANDEPLENVAIIPIIANQEQTPTLTDSEGYYETIEFTRAEVTIKPLLPGWAFTPPSKVITPEDNMANFQARSDKIFPDRNLELHVLWMCYKEEDYHLTFADIEPIESIYAEDKGIRDLTGMEYMPNLRNIVFLNNSISSTDALSSLKKLEHLAIDDNQEKLSLNGLFKLTALKELRLINTIPVSLSPLVDHVDLETARFTGCQLYDLSGLKNMDNLKHLYIKDNGKPLKLVKFRNFLSNLESLYLQNCEIEDFYPLVFADLSSLKSLVVRNDTVNHPNFMSSAHNLETLVISNCEFSDYSFFNEFTKMGFLSLSKCNLSDINFLANMPNIRTINFEFNQITNISILSNLAHIKSLTLTNNNIEDISPLVANPYIAQGVSVDIRNNAFDPHVEPHKGHIETLISRGVDLRYED